MGSLVNHTWGASWTWGMTRGELVGAKDGIMGSYMELVLKHGKLFEAKY